MTSDKAPFVPRLKKAHAPDTGGPGRLLRQAREERGIPLEQIADQLKLSQRKIQALEEDDYSYINSLIFLKGYLRNYANIVGVEADTVIAQINTRLFEENRERPPTIEYKVKLFTRDQILRWMTLGIGVLMVGLVLSWWHSHTQTRDLTILPSTHTQPSLPAKPDNAYDYQLNTPIYQDGDLTNDDSAVEVVTPEPPTPPEQPDPVESFARYDRYTTE